MSARQLVEADWLHDDSEEDLVGADWHQRAIHTLVDCLRDVAATHELPWHVGDQLTLIATKPDGSLWRPKPDVMLHPDGGSQDRDEMSIEDDGVPALIIEVASPTTWDYDIDTRSGKARGYLHLAVPNYLVFDPTPEDRPGLLDAACRGWQSRGGRLREWQPDAAGRYRIPDLGIALGPEGSLLRVFGPDGEPVPFDFEARTELRALQRDAIDQARRVAELEDELASLRATDQGQRRPN